MNSISPTPNDYDDLANRLANVQTRYFQIQEVREKLLAQVIFWRFMALGLAGLVAFLCFFFHFIPR